MFYRCWYHLKSPTFSILHHQMAVCPVLYFVYVSYIHYLLIISYTRHTIENIIDEHKHQHSAANPCLYLKRISHRKYKCWWVNCADDLTVIYVKPNSVSKVEVMLFSRCVIINNLFGVIKTWLLLWLCHCHWCYTLYFIQLTVTVARCRCYVTFALLHIHTSI